MNDFVSMLVQAIIQLLVFALIPFIWWLITARKTNFFAWIGLKKPRFAGSPWKLGGIILGAAAAYALAMFFIVKFLLGTTASATAQFAGKGLGTLPSILAYAIIQTALAEELFFRGFLCKRLSKRFGFVAGNTIQALCFGLLHGVPFGLATGNVLVCVLLTLLPAAIGYFEGWLNEKKSGGSILPSWAMHAVMNILSAVASL